MYEHIIQCSVWLKMSHPGVKLFIIKNVLFLCVGRNLTFTGLEGMVKPPISLLLQCTDNTWSTLIKRNEVFQKILNIEVLLHIYHSIAHYSLLSFTSKVTKKIMFCYSLLLTKIWPIKQLGSGDFVVVVLICFIFNLYISGWNKFIHQKRL